MSKQTVQQLQTQGNILPNKGTVPSKNIGKIQSVKKSVQYIPLIVGIAGFSFAYSRSSKKQNAVAANVFYGISGFLLAYGVADITRAKLENNGSYDGLLGGMALAAGTVTLGATALVNKLVK